MAEHEPRHAERAAVLDYCLGQCDRKTHNVLTHPDDEARPILIDNGLILSPHETVIGSMFVDAFRAKPLSADTIACLKKCLGNAEWYDIQELVGPQAVELAKARVQRLISDNAIDPDADLSVNRFLKFELAEIGG